MPEQIDIATLQDPREILGAFGEYALVGLYLRVYWESLEFVSDSLGKKVPNQVFIKGYQHYQNWLGIASELLPEWATDMLAEIDTALEGDGM